jgi:dTDP-4-dehydrorhamnose 3,5-epimerase
VRTRPLVPPGAFEVSPQRHGDHRGEFLEWYRSTSLETVLGRPVEVTQANLSVSARGVLRGIHYTQVPPGQAKLVTCIAGAVLDAVVDLRVGSPAFGRSELIRLDSRVRSTVWIPEGVGHAFLSLEDGSVVSYLCSTEYDPALEHAVHPLDPALDIPWPLDGPPILSERDDSAPTLHDLRIADLLPTY